MYWEFLFQCIVLTFLLGKPKNFSSPVASVKCSFQMLNYSYWSCIKLLGSVKFLLKSMYHFPPSFFMGIGIPLTSSTCSQSGISFPQISIQAVVSHLISKPIHWWPINFYCLFFPFTVICLHLVITHPLPIWFTLVYYLIFLNVWCFVFFFPFPTISFYMFNFFFLLIPPQSKWDYQTISGRGLYELGKMHWSGNF